MVEIHPSVFSSLNLGVGAEGDDVVAAGDSGEDARLDVHRAVSSSRLVGVIKLDGDSVVV